MRTMVLGSCFMGLTVPACSDDSVAGSGTVRLAISGEEAATLGYPAGEPPDQIAFADGYTMQFSKILVSITEFHLHGLDGTDADVVADPIVVDLHAGDQDLWTFEGVPARRWDNVEYLIAPPTTASRRVGGVTEVDLQQMIHDDLAFLVVGTATNGMESFDFSYGFPFTIEQSHCTNGMDETDGIVVANNAVAEADITIHIDHLFFDTYAVDDANLRFEPMAAMAGPDGRVELGELAGQTLSDIRDRAGMPVLNGDGSPVVYDPGPLMLDANTLKEYVTAAATTVGHFNGEGHCEYTLE